ncbi:GNAT family N-acetyltransferase [Virgibacillus sp. L01]|uniref:GNAT family N-acetyltransferase n=1 Tax=Virgibacillus sp. L01 TaxID=3457429 RepID=UPI003FD58A53
MKLIAANQTSQEKLENFLKSNDNVEQDLLKKKGYVVEIEDNIQGCFILDSIEEGIYWLKQLYITKDYAKSLPVLLEAILAMAKEKQAKKVFVHSHQPMVDVLLEALQFYPQKENDLVDKSPIDKGSWWTYNVS